MVDILHMIQTSAPAKDVRAAITEEKGLKAWWTDDADAKPEVGFVDVFRFHGGQIEFRFRIDEISDSRVAWTCLPGDKVPPEWVDTKVTFALEPTDGGGTTIRFAHTNWQKSDGDYAMCNTSWGKLMHRLRDYAEGKPLEPRFVG